MLGPRGPLIFMALVIGFALWLIIRDKRGGRVSLATLAAMLGESLVLALLFGVVVGTATVHLVGPLRSLAAGGGLDGGPLSRLTLSLGAGLYEELLFRVVIVALLSNGLRLLLGIGRVPAGIVAATSSTRPPPLPLITSQTTIPRWVSLRCQGMGDNHAHRRNVKR